jgi:oxygen-dependent protoporphyrinogen oxidase
MVMRTPRIVIVGAGLTGLATAFWLQRRASHLEVMVLETRDRAGGNVGTDEIHGYRVERGPNGFLDRTPAMPRLVEALGLTDQLVAASRGSRRLRFVYVHGRLHPLPSGPLGLLTTPLLTWRGKKDLLAELWRRPRPPSAANNDESVYDFVARRAGREAAELFADALVTGIQGGDPRQLSMAACFPRVVALEQQYGSIIRGFIGERRQRRRQARLQGQPAPPPAQLWSFREGLQRLIDALSQTLGAALRLGTAVTALRPLPHHGSANGSAPRWVVEATETPPIEADAVVLTCPAYVQAQLLAPLDADLAAEVAAIPYNRIAVVALGYRQVDCPHIPEGFGYIAPQAQRRDVLGVQWCSMIFPQRAPAGMVLWRALCGGVHRGDILDWDDQTLLRAVTQEMRQVLAVQAPPAFSHIYRYPRAIPQYVIGHLARLQRIEVALQRWPHLFLSGNAYRGIALNDCAEEAERLTQEFLRRFPPPPSAPR